MNFSIERQYIETQSDRGGDIGETDYPEGHVAGYSGWAGCEVFDDGFWYTLEQDSTPDTTGQLVTSIVQEDLLLLLADNLHRLPFEARKDSQTIFTYSLRWTTSAKELPPAISYILNNRPEIIVELCQSYARSESALPSGLILQEALKHECIVKIILYHEPDRHFKLDETNPNVPSSGDGVFWQFFDWIDKGTFEVSTDAFKTFRVRHVFQFAACSLLLGDSHTA